MVRIVWSEKYDVNVKRVNEEHQKLFGMINDLYDAMNIGTGQYIVGNIIDGLVDYTKFHFKTEEDIMIRIAYPDYEKHKFQHDAFVKKVAEFQEKFKKGAILLSLDVLKFLEDWLINHICKMDKAYSTYFNKNGIT